MAVVLKRHRLVPRVVVVGSLVAAMQLAHAQSIDGASCHDSFERKSPPFIAPRQNMELTIDESQWPALARLLQRFAQKRDWSYRDSSRRIPGELTSIDVSLCQDTIRILVVENHWLNTRVFDHPDRGLSVILYADTRSDVWQPIGKELYRDLEANWPGKAFFRGADGERINRPAYLN